MVAAVAVLFTKSVYSFPCRTYHGRMEASSTRQIVEALTQAIVEHRLPPGAKLAEQKLADHFGVSRTLVRQALFQLAQHRLVRLEPARGAFVAAPSANEARQVFAVRRMLEAELARDFARQATPARLRALRAHLARERAAVAGSDSGSRHTLLGDFHVRLAELLGNEVLAELLGELVSRSALITRLYQSPGAAVHSHHGHAEIVKALAARDGARAARLMVQHLRQVEASLDFDGPHPRASLGLALA